MTASSGIVNFNPYSRSHLGDPFPVYSALREEAPVHRNERPPFWAVSRFDDVDMVLRHPETFISGAGITLDGFTGLKPMIILMDPPRQGELRRVLQHAFSRSAAVDLLDAMAGRDVVDLVEAFTGPLPVIVIAELLGVDPGDRAAFKSWSDGIMTTTTGDGGALIENYTRIFDYFEQTVADRRRAPRDDLVSELVAAQVGGVSLSDDEILGFCALLLIAGNETTTNLLGNMAILLARHPEVRAQLVDDPSLVPAAVEETLRFEGPVPTLTRTTACEVELRGRTIPAGEKVLLLLAAANRDPRVFDEGDSFDLHRSSSRQLAFGTGIHYCMGANLARLEARVAFEELLARHPRYRINSDPVQYVNTPSIRGPVELRTALAPSTP
jgi:hypothetical protein